MYICFILSQRNTQLTILCNIYLVANMVITKRSSPSQRFRPEHLCIALAVTLITQKHQKT